MAVRLHATGRYTAGVGSSVSILFDNIVDRALYVDLQAVDIGIIGFQTDTKEFFILQSASPITWIPFGGNTGNFLTKPQHAALGPTEFIHTTLALTFPTSVERLAYVASPSDVGKIVRQDDTGDFFLLADDAPLTYLPIGTGGGVSSHLSLSDLLTGDAGHSQFVMLQGRSSGQIVHGGTGPLEDLQLSSTFDVAKGQIVLQDEAQFDANMTMNGDFTFLPDEHGNGSIGLPGFRFKQIWAVEGAFGDILMRRELDDGTKVAYRLKEYPEGIKIIDDLSGREDWLFRWKDAEKQGE